MQVASIRGLYIRQCYRFENSDFAFWAFVFSAVYPNPCWKPVRNAAITHERMVSEDDHLRNGKSGKETDFSAMGRRFIHLCIS